MICGIDYATASFKGVEFEVLPVEESGGRRISTNQYPFADVHFNQDLGKEATKWSIKGCFYGENFRDQINHAKIVWASAGAGVFFEPTQNESFSATLVSYSFDYDNTKLNYVSFSLDLVEASEKPYPSIIGLRGSELDTSIIVKTFLDDARLYYREAAATIRNVAQVYAGLGRSFSFLDNAARSLLQPLSFIKTSKKIRARSNAANADTRFDQNIEVFEAAISSDGGADFFRRASEVRLSEPIQSGEAAIVAATALAYYFEKVASAGTISLLQLDEFRDRANSLKAVVPDLTGNFDKLILAAGRLSSSDCERAAGNGLPALVASYQIFGEVGRAYSIMEKSGGVSGAFLESVVAPCD